MSTRRKLYTSIFSLILIVIVTVAGTSLTLSALNVTLRTGFNVSYTAYNIAADIYCAYKGGAITNFDDGTVTAGGKDKISFTGTETGTPTMQFDPFSIVLTSDNPVALIRYQIVNNNIDKKGFPINIQTTFTPGIDETGNPKPQANLDNFEIGYAVVKDSNKPSDPADSAYSAVTKDLPTITAEDKDVYIFFRFKVKSTDADATCNCDLSFTLGSAS